MNINGVKIAMFTIYTDGSCDDNPGPCGAGALIQNVAGVTLIEHHWALGHGTNNIGELRAVELGLSLITYLEETKIVVPGNTFELKTDSQYALNIPQGLWKAKANLELVASIKAKLVAMRKKYTITMSWVKGHSGDPGNKRADELANLGMAESKLQNQQR